MKKVKFSSVLPGQLFSTHDSNKPIMNIRTKTFIVNAIPDFEYGEDYFNAVCFETGESRLFKDDDDVYVGMVETNGMVTKTIS